jgi:hypothetical protein
MIPVGLGPEKDSAGEVQQQLKTTDPTSRQRGSPHINKPDTVKNIIKERMGKIGRGGLRWAPDTKTDWPTDRLS